MYINDKNTVILIGQRVRSRREHLGMSQTELARIIGYSSRGAVNNVETGKNGIPAQKLPLYANALCMTVDELLEGMNAYDYNAQSEELNHSRVVLDLTGLDDSRRHYYSELFKSINKAIKKQQFDDFVVVDLSEKNDAQKELIQNLIKSTLQQFQINY